jgi:DNA-binding response OmpR family regulator
MTTKPTILIVDDNKSSIDILVEVLSQSFDLITALNGQKAIDIAKDEDIDLILLDIMMPKLDGFSVCKILKTDLQTSKIPIIFLTAKYNMDDIEKGFQLGAVDYLTKPFQPTELLVRINTHIELRSYQKDLEKKVEKEIEKNILNEKLLFQQSKQAEIGELLMHIAHQWKQPLSEIGSINLYHIANLKQNKTIGNNELLESFETTSNILDFMSNTITSFQNFYIPNKENTSFSILEALNDALNIVNASFDFYNIKVSTKINNNSNIFGNKNEYSQVILAILNNIKTIFINREISNPTITINIDTSPNQSILIIEDNGGGIKLDIIDNIFLPFISETKNSGMGMYMSKSIINKLNGTITAENTNNGAKFTITI